jgi:ABC-type Fe3+-siderophore transport system permease subunit
VKAGLVAVSVAASGVLLGIVWYLVAPPLPLMKVEGDRLAYISPEPEQPVAADSWFTILGFAFGIIAAVLVWVLARRARGPLQLIALTLGALAAGYVAFAVGTNINTSFDARRAEAAVNQVVERPAELSASNMRLCLPLLDRCLSVRSGNLLVPALGAVVGYSLLAGWSSWPSLRREEEEAEQLSFAMAQDQAETGPPEPPGSPGPERSPGQGA